VGGFVLITIIGAVILPLAITILVIGVIVWSMRRAIPSGKDAAIQELRDRFARGEIDQSEFQARMDALNREA